MDETFSSEALMIKVGAGDSDAFGVLVKRHQRSILNFVFRCVGDRARAEDICQEVFLRAWQAAGRYRAESKFTTWIFRIAVNLCINEVKSRRRRKWLALFSDETDSDQQDPSAMPLHSSAAAPSPEELFLKSERSAQIFSALDSLPGNQRTAVILKRYEGLSYVEIAEILGCSKSAVDALLVRAKRNLRKKLLPLEKKRGFFS